MCSFTADRTIAHSNCRKIPSPLTSLKAKATQKSNCKGEEPLPALELSIASSKGTQKPTQCYGCGTYVQTLHPDETGFVPPELYDTKKKHRQLNQLLCARCQALSNGAMVPGVADFSTGRVPYPETPVQSARIDHALPLKQLATPAELRRELQCVRNSRALVVMLIDVLDASGSILSHVRDLVGGNPIVVLGSKADLLPNGTNREQVIEWLFSMLNFKRIAVESVHLVSSRTGEGMATAVGSIRKLRQGRDVYVVGAANVGKSAFIRGFVNEMSSTSSKQFDPAAMQKKKHLPVESPMPGTTLRSIPLNVFASGGVLYDTPGLHLHHRLPHILLPEEIKLLNPRKQLRSFVAPSPSSIEGDGQGVAYFWGGLVKIEIMNPNLETQLVFYGPPILRVVGASRGNFIKAGRLDSQIESEPFGTESVKARGGLRMSKETGIESTVDVSISGIPGWVTIYHSATFRAPPSAKLRGETANEQLRIRIWTPVGIEVFVRPPIPVPSPIS
jgi:nitric-oxide synthase